MSKIEWTDATWNPVTGCIPISPGCANCYAKRMANRLAGRFGYPAAPHQFDVTLHPDRLDQPLHWNKPRMVFVVSMGDLFHDDVPDAFLNDVFNIMVNRAPRHTFQVLTKRADRMADFLQSTRWLERGKLEGMTENVWAGASIENQEQADKRIPALLATPAAVRFVSLEPLLGPIELEEYLADHLGREELECRAPWELPLSPAHITQPALDWVIIGGESGPGARPMRPDWAQDIVEQCRSANVPVFVKQMGSAWASSYYKEGRDYLRRAEWPSIAKMPSDTKGAMMEYWPEDLRVREYPAGVSE